MQFDYDVGKGFCVMHISLPRSFLKLCVLLLGCFAGGAVAVDVALSGFGTIGYAQSDQDFTYLRYIDDRGTFKTDSLAGVQADVRFDPQWGATVQAVASAPRTKDDGYEAKFRWAFVSFRPDNEWLFRVGRVRPPIFLNSQNSEVGVTYDQVRLPAEVYALSPVYDFDGAAATKTWSTGDGDINVDTYWGKANLKYRFHHQSAPPQPYFAERVTVRGLIASYSPGTLLLRGGAHYANAKSKEQVPFAERSIPIPVPAPPPFGGTLFVPNDLRWDFRMSFVTFGADWRAGDWRVTAEYLRRIVPDMDVAPASKSGYVTIARQFGKWTPYATYARLLSDPNVRDQYKAIYGVPVPLAVQGPPLFIPANFNGEQSDRISVFDQYSAGLGGSYSFSPTSKLKFEWMRTKIGLASFLADGDANNKSINVFSLSYSAAF